MRYTKEELWKLRTNLPMKYILKYLQVEYKEVEKYIRFMCPNCKEIRAAINPKNNLSHCFACKQNFNNIDLLIQEGYNFRKAVKILKNLFREYEKKDY